MSGALGPWRAFLVSHSLVIELLDRDLRTELGLPLTWYEVMLHLEIAPDGHRRMGDLADRLLLSRSGATRLIDRMVAAGLVGRCGSPGDKRARLASLTPTGRELFRRAVPLHLAGVERHFLAHLKPNERAVLEEALGRVVAAAAPLSGRATLLAALDELRGTATRTPERQRDP
jgi:DNA-binding MarR family transcriptional regulator